MCPILLFYSVDISEWLSLSSIDVAASSLLYSQSSDWFLAPSSLLLLAVSRPAGIFSEGPLRLQSIFPYLDLVLARLV